MRAVKAVEISYKPSQEVLQLLSIFRDIVNSCIRVGLEKGITSRFSLSNEVYHQLREEYNIHSWYALSAIEVATTILRNYRKAKRKNPRVKRPRATKLCAKIGNQGYKIIDGKLRLPIKPREYFYAKLHKRVLKFLPDDTLKLGSVTITARKVVVAFSKTAKVAEPKGYVAFDVNEKSVDGVTSEGEVVQHDLTRIYEVNSNLFERARKFQSERAADRRVQKKVLSKWYRNRNNKVDSELHKISKKIVEKAKKKGYGIILENLKGIRKSVNKRRWRINWFNGKAQRVSVHSKRLKRRLNQACLRKLQRFIKYKSLWEGVKVVTVNPKGTSSKCSICRSKLEYLNVQLAECPECGTLDRQLNAALNILFRIQDESLRFGLDRWVDVVVKRDEGIPKMNSNPQNQNPEVSLRQIS